MMCWRRKHSGSKYEGVGGISGAVRKKIEVMNFWWRKSMEFMRISEEYGINRLFEGRTLEPENVSSIARRGRTLLEEPLVEMLIAHH